VVPSDFAGVRVAAALAGCAAPGGRRQALRVVRQRVAVRLAGWRCTLALGSATRDGPGHLRRKEKANNGDFIDYRRTLRHSMKHGGVPIELRRRHGVPVVFLTAHAEEATIGRARAAEDYYSSLLRFL